MDSHEGFFVGGFTFALVIATILLWRATNRLWEAAAQETLDMQESIQLARNEFNSTHRPKIRSKHIWLVEDIKVGRPILLNFILVNRVIPDATLGAIGFRLDVVRKGQPLPTVPHIPANIQGSGQQLVSGLNLTFPNVVGRALSSDEHLSLWNGFADLFCIGFI